ncbi:MAG: peptide deformylase [Deltaproteobacteria bacterium]|nr:peptide deformylase [Deltaproteobacteria bacterium]
MLKVLKYPNSTLKKMSKPLKDVPQAIRNLARQMFETMYHENGIGLAAPQVGELVRLIVLDVQGFPIVRHWHVVHREHKRLSSVAQAFKEFLLKEAPGLMPGAAGEKKGKGKG